MDMLLFSRRRKKSGKWHFIGGFGRQRRAAVFFCRVFLVPGAAFQKWQSEFAQVLERASEEAALLWLMWSFWVLPSDFGVPEAGWGLRDGVHHGEIPSTFIAHIKPTNTFFHFAV